MLVSNDWLLFWKTVKAEDVDTICRGSAPLLAEPLGLEYGYRSDQIRPNVVMTETRQTKILAERNVGIGQTKRPIQTEKWALARPKCAYSPEQADPNLGIGLT